jgi:hypothetical protein
MIGATIARAASMAEVAVLVDYDNLSVADRRHGLPYLAARIVGALATFEGRCPARVRIRLYGGWYEGRAATPAAQDLSAEAFLCFPAVVPGPMSAGGGKANVRLDLAYALEAEPGMPYMSTFRRREPTTNLSCHDPASKGCRQSPCPMAEVRSVLLSGRCPSAGCAFRTTDLLYRPQQKLVDTMLAIDLVHLATPGTTVAVVTSDDDIVPAMRFATLRGGIVLHLHTHSGYRIAPHYPRSAGRGYTEADL